MPEQALAQTYDSDSGWETVIQYREAKQLREDNPEMARAQIARSVGRPPSAVRGWLKEGKVPAAVKGLRTAKSHGWTEVDSDSERFRAFNLLVAWIYSGGGLRADHFVPLFSVDDPLMLATLTHAFRWLNIAYRCREYENPDNHLEVIPRDGASVLGRILSVLGAPVGIKTTHDDLSLPEYLSTVEEAHQRDFVRIHLLNRGGPYEQDVAGTSVYTPSPTTCEELVKLIDSITVGSATESRQNHVWVSADAVRDLAGDTPIRSALATQAIHGSLSCPSERAFSSTYRQHQNPGGYRYMKLYNRVQGSDLSRNKLADKLSLSSSTIRSWRSGSKPYVLNGLERAFERGWIGIHPDSETSLGLTELLAWVFARGTLRETYFPVFRSVSDTQQNRLKTIASAVGFPWSTYYADDPNHGAEFRPSEDGSVLGRVLYALGSGRNGTVFNKPLIPPYVFHYPAHARAFVEIFALHYMTNCNSPTLTVPSEFSKQLCTSLGKLMSDSLSWTIDRVGPRRFTIVDSDTDNWTEY